MGNARLDKEKDKYVIVKATKEKYIHLAAPPEIRKRENEPPCNKLCGKYRDLVFLTKAAKKSLLLLSSYSQMATTKPRACKRRILRKIIG